MTIMIVFEKGLLGTVVYGHVCPRADGHYLSTLFVLYRKFELVLNRIPAGIDWVANNDVNANVNIRCWDFSPTQQCDGHRISEGLNHYLLVNNIIYFHDVIFLWYNWVVQIKLFGYLIYFHQKVCELLKIWSKQ